MNIKSPDYWLTLDLSTSLGGICLHKDGPLRLISERKLTDKFKHSEQLIDSLDEVLREGNLSLPQISLFITTLGPGSYTGLRIALTTLKALSFVYGTPIAIVPSHECRFLTWSNRHPSLSAQQVNVLTLLSTSSAHLAKYQEGKLTGEIFGTESELSKDKCDVLISEEESFKVENLALIFAQSNLKKIAHSWPEIQALTPEYWGNRYRTISDGENATPKLPKQS